MAQMVTWSEYSSLHSKVAQADFDTAEALAEKEVRNVIGPVRWAQITSDTPFYDVLKDCICNVIDKAATDNETGRASGVTSVSNDGYTEKYNSGGAVDLHNETASSIRAWLSGTGLVGAY